MFLSTQAGGVLFDTLWQKVVTSMNYLLGNTPSCEMNGSLGVIGSVLVS
jgi:hypothetical protein